MVVQPKPINITAPKKMMYKAQFMMKNWDDPDVQWNIALGNTE